MSQHDPKRREHSRACRHRGGQGTEWHRVKFFGKLAEIAGEYLRKGSQCYVEGSIRYSDFTGDDGVKKFYTDIVCDELQMLGGKGEGVQRQETRKTAATDDLPDF